MKLLLPTLAQMFFLFAFLFFGFLLAKLRFLPDGSAAVLSKLENALFIPALVLGTFIKNCTLDTLGRAGRILLFSLALEVIIIPLAILLSRLCAKTRYLRKIYTYGLAFANFGFMGNAVVSALFPDIFFEYLVFTLPLWFFIYAWAVPALLLPGDEGGARFSLGRTLRSFFNPMFICMAIGVILGLSGLVIPAFITNVIDTAGACMSPIAMLLTGITIAHLDLGKVLRRRGIYIATALRLVVLPIVFMLLIRLLPLADDTFFICAVCSLAMPLGLNTVVVPSAYGMDTSDAAGMALVSHAASIVTIPLVFMLMQSLL